MHMKRALLALLCWTSVAAPRPAAPEEASALVVLKGVDSADEAAAVMQRWARVSSLIGKVLQVPAGYPRTVTRSEFPEIKQGRQLVILGVCPADRAQSIVRQLEVPLSSGFVQEVGLKGALACPKPVDGWSFVEGSWVSVKAGVNDLDSDRYERTDPQTGAQQTLVHLYQRDASMDLVGSQELTFAAGCTTSVTGDASAIRIEKTCTASGEPPKEVLRFTIANGKIAQALDASTMKDLRALVWVSGKTEEAARDAIARWDREKIAVADLVSLAPGFPKVARAEDYPGLTPGTHAVLLGLCPASRLEQEGGWKVLQAFDPNARLVSVKARAGEPACPAASDKGTVAWSKRLRSGAHDLTVTTFVNSARIWDLRVFLRGPNGALLDWKREDARTSEQHKQGGQCMSLPEAGDTPSAIEVSFYCYDLSGDELLSSELAWSQDFTYSIEAGKLAVKMRVDPPKKRRK
jgi:hypothetical protein